MAFDRIVLVTRQTDLEALIERFQTVSQAEFYLKQAGQDIGPAKRAHETYQGALKAVRQGMPADLKLHMFERRHLPQYRFEASDIVVTLGQDGLVANVAKYLDGQPLIAVNPDPKTIDGILLPTQVEEFTKVIGRTKSESANVKGVTMAEARLSDGQTLRAVNDIFIGAKSHVSARYRISHDGKEEEHSSSGIIVSTGVGSTGWLKSVYAGAAGVLNCMCPRVELPTPKPIPWDTEKLIFNVREPWPSLMTRTEVISGWIKTGAELAIISRMPAGGVIFGDGIENDYLEFNSGISARLELADQRLNLVLD